MILQAEDAIHNKEDNENTLEDYQRKPPLSNQGHFAHALRGGAVVVKIFEISRGPRQKKDRHLFLCVFRLPSSATWRREQRATH